jgi:NAD-dependent dihydropyrimidine dehydrogenase PreA subunit
MIRIDLVNYEEFHQMDVHKWLVSEKAGHDVGQEAYFDWIKKYAALFRQWVNSLPSNCIGCGACNQKADECPHPFKEERIQYLSKESRSFVNSK